MPVAGTRAVVTGAGHGIGAAIATALADRGAAVVVNDRDADASAEVAAGIGAQAIAADVSSERAVAALVADAADRLGAIDAWFGNAGVDAGFSLDADEADWDEAWNVNVLAHVRAARLLVPRWLEAGGGRFVVTASAAGLLTMLGNPAYSVSKHGAVAFAEWLSATYAHRGVVAQAICPQGVRTAMYDNAGPLQSLLSHDAALAPTDVAEAVLDGLADDRFLILPHPEVAGYYRRRADDTDRWLKGMNRLQRGIESTGATR